MGDPEQTDPGPSGAAAAPIAWPPFSYWMKVGVALLLVVAAAIAIFALRDIALLIVAALVIAIGMQPAIDWLQARGLSRGAGVGLIMAALMATAVLVAALILPVVVGQVSELITTAPEALTNAQKDGGFLEKLDKQFGVIPKLEDVGEVLPDVALTAASTGLAMILAVATIFILTAYFAGTIPQMRRGIARLLHMDHRENFIVILERSTTKIGMYLLGNLFISVTAGITSFVTLSLLGLPYALALATWVALTDVIPTFGAYLGAIPALIIAAFVGGPAFIGTLLFFVIYQQLENYLIQPRVMRHAIAMPPAGVIIAVLVGARLFGVIGAVLALPVAAIITLALEELWVEDRVAEVQEADEAEARKMSRRFGRRFGRRKPEPKS